MKKTTKTKDKPRKSEANSLMEAELECESPNSPSRQAQLAYQEPEFKLSWQNQVNLHIARHLIRLRRYQGLSQAELAQAMGTSQPTIARLESAEGNITLDTLQRAIVALSGRFDISISPAEINLPPRLPWWELLSGAVWEVVDWQVEARQFEGRRHLWLSAQFRQDATVDTAQAWPAELTAQGVINE